MTDERSNGGLSRRNLLLASAGAAAGLAMTAQGTVQAAAAQPFRPRRRLRRRPNFLIIMVDEMRHAPVYENETLKAWRLANLPEQNSLRRNGFEFTHHHIMSTACQPSRASIYTGQYPSLHGVSQTSGSAKTAIEQDLFWLDPTTVPTLGNWFRAGGYDTYWKGKWHVSDTDLYQPGTYQPLPSYTDRGARDRRLEEIYLEAGILERYGFTGFIGPEPHGSNPLNSASSAGPNGRGRDRVYAELAVEQLRRLRRSERPWLMVTSFVNPHDITLWGALSLAMGASGAANALYLAPQLAGSNVPRDLFDPLYERSANESLRTKPDAQAHFVEQYPMGFQPTGEANPMRRFYYQLHKEVDQHIGSVMDTLRSDRRMYRDTIVIFLSDHGELLGAHGGMFQKWHNAYDEMLRVPLVFHNPELFDGVEQSDVLTSHADLLPTMLGLAGLDELSLAPQLAKTHTQVRRLVGRDLSGYLLGERDISEERDSPVFFMTDDQIFRGSNAVSFTGMSYEPVAQPASVETVVAYLPTGPGAVAERWKYSRYWDNPAFWSQPGVQDVQTFVPGKVNTPGTRTAVTTVKAPQPTTGQVAPPADQFELYNVSQDPAELDNLVDDPTYAPQLAVLKRLLDAEREAKRLAPVSQPWADGSTQQFPFTGS